MPACKIQCKDDQEAECGTCRHRDKGYPWPGEPGGKMVIKGKDEAGVMISVPAITESSADIVLALLTGRGLWSHWE